MRGKNKSEKKLLDDFTLVSEFIKVEKSKHIVYAVFLVPEKMDHDGDIISEEDVEKVAHIFMAEFRDIDEMHKQVIAADPVESFIAWQDMDFHGKRIVKGTWAGAIKIYDDDIWEKVEQGKLRACSVRIKGIRTPERV
jgi:hypothetical protein